MVILDSDLQRTGGRYLPLVDDRLVCRLAFRASNNHLKNHDQKDVDYRSWESCSHLRMDVHKCLLRAATYI
jgi:hypothetical protein